MYKIHENTRENSSNKSASPSRTVRLRHHVELSRTMRTIDLPIDLCAKIQFYTTACSKSPFLGSVEMIEGALGIRDQNFLEFSSWPN